MGLNLKKIKKELEERKQQLEQDLERISHEEFSDKGSQDDGDLAASATMETLRNSLQGTEEAEYKQVLEALAAIDAGTYGVCVDCQGPIAEKRLQYAPNAARCLACQEALEQLV